MRMVEQKGGEDRKFDMVGFLCEDQLGIEASRYHHLDWKYACRGLAILINITLLYGEDGANESMGGVSTLVAR